MNISSIMNISESLLETLELEINIITYTLIHMFTYVNDLLLRLLMGCYVFQISFSMLDEGKY